MGQLIKKINCPRGTHEDLTASCAIYDDGSSYCFSCNHYTRNAAEPSTAIEKPKPEDIKERLEYIDKLPSIQHRGLEFRHDSRGYYTVWPSRDYYKLRLWAPRSGEPKYIGAKGLKKPWFCIPKETYTRTCLLTEGEINALSIAKVISNITIISPGGATNFHDSEMKSKVDYFKDYSVILVLVDDDEAGNNAALNFHRLVKPYCLDIRIKLMQKGHDANDILQRTNGKAELKEEIMGM